MGLTEAVLIGKFIVKQVYLRKPGKYQVNNLNLRIKLEKEWALSVLLLISMSEGFSVPCYTKPLLKLLPKRS